MNHSDQQTPASRRGEKLGWTLGWFGGFIWVILLSILWLVKGQVEAGITGLALFIVGAAVIITFAPWRHPDTPYWKLMLPVYAAFFLTVAWTIRTAGGFQGLGVTWWSFSWLLPMFVPFATIGKRRWRDGERPLRT